MSGAETNEPTCKLCALCFRCFRLIREQKSMELTDDTITSWIDQPICDKFCVNQGDTLE